MDAAAFQILLDEIQALDAQQGIDMNELINVSDGLRQVLVWMIRTNGFQASDLEGFLEQEPSGVQKLLDGLAEKNMVEEMKATQTYYAQVASSRVARKYRVSPDIWKAFD
jgi:hypothetical protein